MDRMNGNGGNNSNSGQENPERITRRKFFLRIGSAVLAITAAGGAMISWKFLSPGMLKEPAMKFDAGKPGDYSPESVTPDDEHKVFIVREKGGDFYALSSVCTHLGCIISWKSGDNVFSCPCHGSKFDREGKVIETPAPQSLPRYAIHLDDNGHLVIDKTRITGENEVLKLKA